MTDLILSIGAISGFLFALGGLCFIADYVIPRITFINDWFERHNPSPEIDE